MDKQIFEAYIKQTQQIAMRLASDPSALLDIMQVIEKHKPFIGANPLSWEEFFKGESSFYSGQYEKSLQHYLAAKDLPHYHFFCFRTSCFVARARGNQEQAINFAKKALKLNPNDEILKQFLYDLNTAPSPKPAESSFKVTIGEKEMAELASIFEEPPQKSEELFSREFENGKNSAAASNELREPKAFSLEKNQPIANATLQTLEPSLDSPRQIQSEGSGGPASAALALDSGRLMERTQARNQSLPLEEINKETARTALKRLAEERPITEEKENNYFGKEAALEKRIESFQNQQAKQLQEYLGYTQKRPPVLDNIFLVLNGWDKHPSLEIDTSQHANAQGLILTDQTRKSSGGHFLRWNGKGVVINPEEGFLNHFHENGFSLQDIDAIIVTKGQDSAYCDIKTIYELNNELNSIRDELHIIHYYLSQKAYEDLTKILKPNFKQARHTVHSLELFIDSPDVEKIDINDTITLHYFVACAQDSLYKPAQSKSEYSQAATLGIRLELRETANDRTPTRISYISGAGWSPLLAHHLGVCEVLVAAFGNTTPSDYTKSSYQEDSLGYHGTYSLLEEIAPRVLISTEFGGREGDIRIEAIKNLRKDLATSGSRVPQEATILPGDIGLYIDLKSLKIRCSVTQDFIDPQHIRVAKSTDAFGRLSYLSPNCYL